MSNSAHTTHRSLVIHALFFDFPGWRADFWYGWFLDPMTKGEYPQSMRDTVGSRLPTFTADQLKVLYVCVQLCAVCCTVCCWMDHMVVLCDFLISSVVYFCILLHIVDVFLMVVF